MLINEKKRKRKNPWNPPLSPSSSLSLFAEKEAKMDFSRGFSGAEWTMRARVRDRRGPAGWKAVPRNG